MISSIDDAAREASEVRNRTEQLLARARAISRTVENKLRTLLSRKPDTAAGGQTAVNPTALAKPC
jgi:hypothetical protein